jgi:hypothetical protein
VCRCSREAHDAVSHRSICMLAAAEIKAKLEFEAARQQKILKVECEAKMHQKMKAMLEFEAARQQKLPQFQEPPVSVPPLGGDAGWTEAELQKMDNRTIVKVIVLSSAFAFFAPAHS